MGPQGNMEKQNTQRKGDLSVGEGMHICVLYIYIYTHTYTHMCALYCIYLHPYTQKHPEVDLKAISRNRRYEL